MLKIIPSCVLSSTRSSTGTRPPHRLGGAHRRGVPYSSHRAPQRVRLRPVLRPESSPLALSQFGGSLRCCLSLTKCCVYPANPLPFEQRVWCTLGQCQQADVL